MRRDTELSGDTDEAVDDNGKLKYIRTAKTRVIESEMSSSLPLQVLVYYNAYYSLLMFVILALMYSYMQVYLTDALNVLNLVILSLWAITESLRLYAVSSGKLSRMFPVKP